MLSRRNILPFVWSALAWTAVGMGVVWFGAPSPSQAAKQLLGLVVLCLADLYSLAKAVECVLSLSGIAPEKRGAALVQTFFWATTKLACLGIFILVLSKGVHFATSSLLLGLGTMIVVPLFGGYFWSRRELEHA